MDNYISQAIKTESIDNFKVDHPRLLHVAMGLCTEVGELLTATEGDLQNVKEELGDLLWYCAVAADVFEVTFHEIASLANLSVVDDDQIKALVRYSSEALDHMKKVCFYGVPVNTTTFGVNIGSVIYAVQVLAHDEGWTIAELQATNIAKLRKRYGEKFTTEAAVNRDLKAEAEVMG